MSVTPVVPPPPRKSHCPHGHALIGENAIFYDGTYKCRRCRQEYYLEKKKGIQRKYPRLVRLRLTKAIIDQYGLPENDIIRIRVVLGNFRREHNIDLKLHEYVDLLHKQNNCCGSCGDPFPVDTPYVRHLDHDHKTMQVRGILCHFCNTGMGCFRDDTDRLRKAIVYLEKSARTASKSFA